MKVDNVTVTLVKPNAGLIGFASAVLNDMVHVSGIAIHEKRDGSGYRLTYPTRKSGNQIFHLFHPINKSASHTMERAIFDELKNVITKGSNHVGYHSDQPAAS